MVPALPWSPHRTAVPLRVGASTCPAPELPTDTRPSVEAPSARGHQANKYVKSILIVLSKTGKESVFSGASNALLTAAVRRPT